MLTEPSHTPGRETAGRPATDSTRAQVRSENSPDFHSVTSWGLADGQPARPHGAERRGGPGRKGSARGQCRLREASTPPGTGLDVGAEEHHQPPEARAVYPASWGAVGGGL